jgi:hypothetical protein
MKDVLRGAGVPCARHKRLNSAAEGWVFAREVGFPMIVKPPDAAAAKGTFRVTDARTASRRHSTPCVPSPDHPAVAEEFVTGLERSFETVSIRGRAVWDSSTRYNPAPLHVLENPWIQWTVLLPREVETSDTQAVRPYARAALEALGMRTGISHMEWFRRDRAGTGPGPVAISEVGARPPGAQIMSINSYAHDVDFYRCGRAWSCTRPSTRRAASSPPAPRSSAVRAATRGVRRVVADPRPRAGAEGARPARRRGQAPAGRPAEAPRATRARATRSSATPTPSLLERALATPRRPRARRARLNGSSSPS